MKRVIIVQARTGSTRLPGKVLMDLAGAPMLAQQIRRLKRCTRADEIVVATSTLDADNSIVPIAEAEGVRWYRGSETDVLSRYVGAAAESGADLVVRITADCPLIDPEITGRVIAALQAKEGELDYVSNVRPRTFPKGLDVEALYREPLERTHQLARTPPAREHVTYFIAMERPDLFATGSVVDDEDNSDLSWTVDTEADLAHVRWLYEGLRLGERDVPYRDVLAFARQV